MISKQELYEAIKANDLPFVTEHLKAKEPPQVKLLLSYNIHNGDYFRIIDAAVAKGNIDIVKHLSSFLEPADLVNSLVVAAREGHLAIVQHLVDRRKVHELRVSGFGGIRAALVAAAEAGKFEVVRCLASYSNKELTYEREPALRAAAEKGHVEIVQYLIEEPEIRVDVNTSFFGKAKTALECAADQGKIGVVKLLIRHPELRQEGLANALACAAEKDHLDVVICLVEETKVNVNSKTKLDSKKAVTALERAIQTQSFAVANWLLQQDSLVLKQCSMSNCLSLSAKAGNLKTFKRLVEDPAFKKERTDLIMLMHDAVAGGSLELVRYFFEKFPDSDVHAKYDGSTLLHRVVPTNHDQKEELFAYLIGKGADLNLADERGQTLLHVAAASHCRMEFILKELIGVNDTAVDKKGQTALHTAAAIGYLELVDYLVTHRNHSHVDLPDNEGRTPFFFAVVSQHEAIVNFLVEKGADSTLKDKHNGENFLHKLLDSNFLNTRPERIPNYTLSEIINALVQRGVSVNDRDSDGRTSLHRAVILNDQAVVAHLLYHHSAAIVADNYGMTPLHLAAKGDSLEVVKLFGLEELEEIDINAPDSSGRTLLHSAASADNLDIVQYLIENGADLAVKDKDGKTLLRLAAEFGSAQVIDYLMKERLADGADIDPTKSDDLGMLLHLAVGSGSIRLVESLIKEEEVDVDAKDEDGQTPLFIALRRGYFNIADCLIENEADINAVVKDGTLLHSALRATFISEELIVYLIDNKADLNKVVNGQTPLDSAYECGCSQKVIKLLRAEGAFRGTAKLGTVKETQRPVSQSTAPCDPGTPSTNVDWKQTVISLLRDTRSLLWRWVLIGWECLSLLFKKDTFKKNAPVNHGSTVTRGAAGKSSGGPNSSQPVIPSSEPSLKNGAEKTTGRLSRSV